MKDKRSRRIHQRRVNHKHTFWIAGAICLLAVAVIAGFYMTTGKNTDSKKRSTRAEAAAKKKISDQTIENVSKQAVTPEAVQKAEADTIQPAVEAAQVLAREVQQQQQAQQQQAQQQQQQAQQQQQTPGAYAESEGGRKVYLTFDDGCSVQTDRILDILAQYNVKATFFVTAQGGEENAARYRRIVAEGHSIGLHSVSHNYKQVYASLDSYIADVEGIRQFVLDVTGVNSHLYRFPGGSSNSVSTFPIEDCIRYLNQNGYRYFDWNVDTSDSVNHRQSAQELAARALEGGVDKYHNSVILMHDSGKQDTTVEALPMIIEGLQAKGLEILPITGATPPCQHRKAESVQ